MRRALFAAALAALTAAPAAAQEPFEHFMLEFTGYRPGESAHDTAEELIFNTENISWAEACGGDTDPRSDQWSWNTERLVYTCIHTFYPGGGTGSAATTNRWVVRELWSEASEALGALTWDEARARHATPTPDPPAPEPLTFADVTFSVTSAEFRPRFQSGYVLGELAATGGAAPLSYSITSTTNVGDGFVRIYGDQLVLFVPTNRDWTGTGNITVRVTDSATPTAATVDATITVTVQ